MKVQQRPPLLQILMHFSLPCQLPNCLQQEIQVRAAPSVVPEASLPPRGLAGLAVGRRRPHRGSPLPFGGPAAVLPTSLISKCPGEDVVSRDGHGHDAYVARALTLA